MKSLDEVIEKIEKMWVCPSSDESAEYCDFMEVKEDALHYLRELKLFRQTPIMQGIHKAQRDCALYPVSDFGEDEFDFNPPLTWDELRTMVGKPVWLEDSNHQGEWVLLSGMEDDILYFVYRTCNEYKIYRKEHGTLWQAYRKERK